MNFFISLIYFISIYLLSSLLDRKYKVIDKFRDKDNKSLRRIINISSFISLIIVFTIPLLGKFFKALDIYIIYLQGIFGIPFLFKMYIKNIIYQKELTDKVTDKMNNKDEDVKIDFCYYCGSKLDGSSRCPSCGKELVL